MKTRLHLWLASFLVLVCLLPTAWAQPMLKISPPHGVRFEFGLASYAFRNHPLEDVVRCAAGLRIRNLTLKANHLPLDASDQKIASVLETSRAAGLQVYAAGVIYMKNAHDVEQAFELARRAEIGLIVGVPQPSLLDIVEQKVIETGVRIAIHIHGNRKDLYPDAASVHELVKDRDPRIGICLDVGHTVRLNQDPAEIIRRYADRILDVQLWDCSSATHGGKAVLAGDGVLDFRAIMQALVDIGYDGTVAIEFWTAPDAPEYGTAQTLGFLEGVLSTLDTHQDGPPANMPTRLNTPTSMPDAPPNPTRVTGIGGFFFHSPDPDRTNTWYAKHLGIPLAHNDHARPSAWQQKAGPTVFSADPIPVQAPDGTPHPGWRINLRVTDLDALIDQLRRDGLAVDGPEAYPNGRFAWVHDPDGNEIELWQPGGSDAAPTP